VLLLAIAIITASVDLPGRLTLGPVSVLGALTALVCFSAVVLVICAREIPRAAALSGGLLCLLAAYECVSLLWSAAITLGSIQQITAHLGTGLLILASAAHARNEGMRRALLIRIGACGAIAACVYVLSVPIHGPGNGQWLGARSFGMYGVFAVACLWSLPAPVPLWARAGRVMVPVGILLSLSRTAFAVSLLLIVLSKVSLRFPLRRAVRVLPYALLVVGGAWLAWEEYAPFRAMFVTGDNALAIGGFSLNTSGRYFMWSRLLEAWRQSPLFGHGAGASMRYLAANYYFDGFRQPHNEYLRLAVDGGLVAVLLWIGGLTGLLATAVSRLRVSERIGHTGHPIHRATALCILGLFLLASTDNPAIYFFCWVPVAVVVGASAGLSVPVRTVRRTLPRFRIGAS
jgi:O-antigen ligase